jgi:hypothetical protein
MREAASRTGALWPRPAAAAGSGKPCQARDALLWRSRARAIPTASASIVLSGDAEVTPSIYHRSRAEDIGMRIAARVTKEGDRSCHCDVRAFPGSR